MARRSGARTSSRPAARSAPPRQAAAPPPPPRAAAPPPPPPAAAPAAAPPAPAAGGGMMGGLMGSMASGMAMGTGMAVANRAVDAVMGPRTTEVVHKHEGEGAAPAAACAPAAQDRCFNEKDWVKQCMQQNNGDMTNCNYYADLLKQCQAAPGA